MTGYSSRLRPISYTLPSEDEWEEMTRLYSENKLRASFRKHLTSIGEEPDVDAFRSSYQFPHEVTTTELLVRTYYLYGLFRGDEPAIPLMKTIGGVLSKRPDLISGSRSLVRRKRRIQAAARDEWRGVYGDFTEESLMWLSVFVERFPLARLQSDPILPIPHIDWAVGRDFETYSPYFIQGFPVDEIDDLVRNGIDLDFATEISSVKQ